MNLKIILVSCLLLINFIAISNDELKKIAPNIYPYLIEQNNKTVLALQQFSSKEPTKFIKEVFNTWRRGLDNESEEIYLDSEVINPQLIELLNFVKLEHKDDFSKEYINFRNNYVFKHKQFPSSYQSLLLSFDPQTQAKEFAILRENAEIEDYLQMFQLQTVLKYNDNLNLMPSKEIRNKILTDIKLALNTFEKNIKHNPDHLNLSEQFHNLHMFSSPMSSNQIEEFDKLFLKNLKLVHKFNTLQKNYEDKIITTDFSYDYTLSVQYFDQLLEILPELRLQDAYHALSLYLLSNIEDSKKTKLIEIMLKDKEISNEDLIFTLGSNKLTSVFNKYAKEINNKNLKKRIQKIVKQSKDIEINESYSEAKLDSKPFDSTFTCKTICEYARKQILIQEDNIGFSTGMFGKEFGVLSINLPFLMQISDTCNLKAKQNFKLLFKENLGCELKPTWKNFYKSFKISSSSNNGGLALNPYSNYGYNYLLETLNYMDYQKNFQNEKNLRNKLRAEIEKGISKHLTKDFPLISYHFNSSYHRNLLSLLLENVNDPKLKNHIFQYINNISDKNNAQVVQYSKTHKFFNNIYDKKLLLKGMVPGALVANYSKYKVDPNKKNLINLSNSVDNFNKELDNLLEISNNSIDVTHLHDQGGLAPYYLPPSINSYVESLNLLKDKSKGNSKSLAKYETLIKEAKTKLFNLVNGSGFIGPLKGEMYKDSKYWTTPLYGKALFNLMSEEEKNQCAKIYKNKPFNSFGICKVNNEPSKTQLHNF